MPSPIAPDVVYKLNSVGDPALSPDGSLLAYTLSWVDTQKLEGRSRIMLMDLESGQTVEFTRGQRDVAPKFSPDCQTLGFLRPDENDKRQVWLMGTRGGEAARRVALRRLRAARQTWHGLQAARGYWSAPMFPRSLQIEMASPSRPLGSPKSTASGTVSTPWDGAAMPTSTCSP